MSISLSKSLLNCKVNTGNASRSESSRFQNSNLMVCPTWNHMDLSGRVVCPNSFNNTTAGCSNPMDRVSVENNVSRPQYSEHVTLNAAGIRGGCVQTSESFNGVPLQSCNSLHVASQQQTNEEYSAYAHAGAWGNNLNGQLQSTCNGDAYANAMAAEATNARQAQALAHSVESYQNQQNCGM